MDFNYFYFEWLNLIHIHRVNQFTIQMKYLHIRKHENDSLLIKNSNLKFNTKKKYLSYNSIQFFECTVHQVIQIQVKIQIQIEIHYDFFQQ